MKAFGVQTHRQQSVLALATLFLMTGLVPGSERNPPTRCAQSGETLNAPANEVLAQKSSGNYDTFAPIVKRVAPAAVRIVTALVPESLDDPASARENSAPAYSFGQMRPSGSPLDYALGSGVIITEDGYILTNCHVVDGATEIEVTLQDGRQFKAKVIGLDPPSDIAVVKIPAQHLPRVALAESQKVQVGDVVLAIGNPFGVGQSVTHGIVSATDRGIDVQPYERFIQTDAPINPGNSGGALVDVTGQLIGINTVILSSSGGNQGIGFAISSDLARRVMADLVKYGHVLRGFLGIEAQDLTPELAREFRQHSATGALVSGVAPNSPAQKAGIELGDVIMRFDSEEVTDARHLGLLVADAKPCQTVRVEVVHNGSAKPVRVILGQAPDTETVGKSEQSSDQQAPGTLAGVTLIDLSSQVRQYLKIPRSVTGVVVLDLHAYSAAAQAGLQPGDVIESINRQEVGDAEELLQFAKSARRRNMLLRVWSNGGSRFVLVDEGPTRSLPDHTKMVNSASD